MTETLTDIIASAGNMLDAYDQLLASDSDCIRYNGSQEWTETDVMDELDLATELLSDFITDELTIESALAWTARTNIWRAMGLDLTGHDDDGDPDWHEGKPVRLLCTRCDEVRSVTRTGVGNPADPTTYYVLECGHTEI